VANTHRPKLRVLAVSDGRPGHFNQVKGVLRALGYHFEITTDWWEIRLRTGALRRLLGWWLNSSRRAPDASWLKWFYRGAPAPRVHPDLVISAGGNTLYANAWLARRHACRNIFVGDIRKLEPRLFWRVISYLPASPSPPFIHWPFTPVPITPEDLPLPHGQAAPVWALLIGGDGGGYRYTAQDWDDLVQALRGIHEALGVRWALTTSRRTGREGEERLRALEGNGLVARLSLFSRDQGDHYLDLVGMAERILCTEDSHMMLTEAIASGRPVLSVRPRHGQAHASNQYFIDQYLAAGLLQRRSLQELAGAWTPWEPRPGTLPPSLRELGDLLHAALDQP